jgi:hypothetical protein
MAGPARDHNEAHLQQRIDLATTLRWTERMGMNETVANRRELRLLSDEIASKTARGIEEYPELEQQHIAELKCILDEDG